MKRVKSIRTTHDDGIEINVRIEITSLKNALTRGEQNAMITKLTDDTMLALARVPYGNVPLSQMKIV